MKERMRVTILLMAAMAAGYVGGMMSQTNTRAAALNITPTTSDVVRASKFELVDTDGKVLGTFGTDKGEPSLSLIDAAGKMRGTFRITKGEARLGLWDAAGKLRGVFGTMEDEPHVVLWDAAGKISWSTP